jgi:hypothetical protein
LKPVIIPGNAENNSVNNRPQGREAVVYHAAARHGEPGKEMICSRIL